MRCVHSWLIARVQMLVTQLRSLLPIWAAMSVDFCWNIYREIVMNSVAQVMNVERDMMQRPSSFNHHVDGSEKK